MKKFVIFKSPMCGPCKMFLPQIQIASKELNIPYEEVDVTTDEGFEKANNNKVSSSGVLILFEDDKEIKRWNRPCAAKTLIEDCQ